MLNNLTHRQARRFITLISLLTCGILLNRCGKTKVTPASSEVDGLPESWDGTSDYEAQGWGFENP